MAIVVASVANLMSEATAPCMGRPVTNAKVLIIFKLCVIPRLQPRWHRALTEARSHSHCRHGSMGSNSGHGKEGSKRQHFKKKMPKKPLKQNAYEVIFKNSVLSEVTTTSGGERENDGKVSSKMVLSGPEEEGTYNRFSCFAVHSKMSQSTNAKSKPLEGLYTDTDPDNRSEIITDITIRMPGKAGTMMMEVKVDPGVQPSCIPLHKFKTLFPHLCRDGLPKEGLLDNTQN